MRLDRLREIARARAGTGPAHDWLHILRVAKNADELARAAGADVDIAVAAALLHELVNLPKNHPDSSRSGELCAAEALVVLCETGDWSDAEVAAISDAISTHGWSRGVVGATLEARILQDADRLDAIGAIGVARAFATCAEMGRPFYDPADPLCADRAPDDKQWGLDHFYKKLLGIAEGLHTERARQIGAARSAFLRAYLDQLATEI